MGHQLYLELREIALQDATVYRFLADQQNRTYAPDLDTAIALIKQLVIEKKAYYDDAVATRANSIVPIRSEPLY